MRKAGIVRLSYDKLRKLLLLDDRYEVTGVISYWRNRMLRNVDIIIEGDVDNLPEVREGEEFQTVYLEDLMDEESLKHHLRKAFDNIFRYYDEYKYGGEVNEEI